MPTPQYQLLVMDMPAWPEELKERVQTLLRTRFRPQGRGGQIAATSDLDVGPIGG